MKSKIISLYLLLPLFQGLAWSSDEDEELAFNSMIDCDFHESNPFGQEFTHGIDGMKSTIFEFAFTNTGVVDICVDDPESQMIYLVDFGTSNSGIGIYLNQKYINFYFYFYFSRTIYSVDFESIDPEFFNTETHGIEFEHGMGSEITAGMDSIYFSYTEYFDDSDSPDYYDDDHYDADMLVSWGKNAYFYELKDIDQYDEFLPFFEGDSMIGGKAGSAVYDVDEGDGFDYHERENAAADLYAAMNDNGDPLIDAYLGHAEIDEHNITIAHNATIPKPRFYALFVGIISLGLVVFRRIKNN